MDPSLFRYIWRHSRRDQILICSVVLASLPLYFASLDLPRRIVNEAIQGKAFAHGETTARFLVLHLPLPEWLGGDRPLFEGFAVDRYELLFGLSGLFLILVLINGGFKYWINLAKGALGERMLRRMRFELFALVLRFSPEAQRQTKAAEVATIIKDEVEPIGGFIGDAFILPAFLGTQAATALAFILIQNVWLGLMAGGVVAIQFVVIPRLRRELLKLGRARQLASRRLAGRVGEVMDGIEAIHVHGAGAWERAEIGHRLFELFDLRLRIYQRKFMVKFLNNLLAQLTPFFFYAVGGYFALKGHLDIGQLVAVIAAYRDLPPPLKELIDWDQQRLDVQVKYDQVVQQFAPDRLLPPESVEAGDPAARAEPLAGELKVEGLALHDAHGPLLEGVDLDLALPARLAVVGDGGPAASAFVRMLAGRVADHAGTVTLGDRPLADWTPAERARRLAYAGIDPVLFPGSLRDNVVYGLRRPPPIEAHPASLEARRRIAEAKRTGNPLDDVAGPWIDLERAGASDAAALDGRILALLAAAGMRADLYRFGLLGRVDPERQPELASRIIEARAALRAGLEAGGMAGLVEPFDPERYNTQATLSENLLFGVPTGRALAGRQIVEHPSVRAVLDGAGLTEDLVEMGAQIAATMTEIFRGLPGGHPLFEQFSFISADELPEFEAILARRQAGGRAARGAEDRNHLLALPLAYIEPRHRLGLLDDALRDRIVAARGPLRERLEADASAEEGPGVEFYDPERVCAAAPLRDNLLFGRIDQRAAGANTQVTAAITEVVAEMRLEGAIERVGLDHQVGPAGRLLSAPQRALVGLVRCLVRRPDLLVIDGGLAPLGETRARAILAWLREGAPAPALAPGCEGDAEASPETAGEASEDASGDAQGHPEPATSLVVTLPNVREAAGFDAVLRAEGTHLAPVVAEALPSPQPADDPEAAASEDASPPAEAEGDADGEPRPEPDAPPRDEETVPDEPPAAPARRVADEVA